MYERTTFFLQNLIASTKPPPVIPTNIILIREAHFRDYIQLIGNKFSNRNVIAIYNTLLRTPKEKNKQTKPIEETFYNDKRKAEKNRSPHK